MPPLLFIPLAFLCGSIPSGLLIARAKGIDIRKHGSGNIGATNVGRVLGKGWFFVCFLCDFVKGFLPVFWAGYSFGQIGRFDVETPANWVWVATMVAAVLGNVFNPWLGGKGGKGVATSIGAMTGLFPAMAVPGLILLAAWLITLKLSGYISLSSMVAGCVLPVAVFVQSLLCARWSGSYHRDVLERAVPLMLVAVLLCGLVIWTHRANIKRLRAGTEPKAGAGKQAAHAAGTRLPPRGALGEAREPG